MNLFHRGVYMAPETGGGGGGSDEDFFTQLFGNDDQGAAGAGDQGAGGGQGGQNPLEISDELLDKLADRIVAKQTGGGQQAQGGNRTATEADAGPFGAFMQQVTQTVRAEILNSMGGSLVENTVRKLTAQGMPSEVVNAVAQQMANMPGAEIEQMQKSRGDEVLANALYGSMVRAGKIVPQVPAGNAGETGDTLNAGPNADSALVAQFKEQFMHFNGRPPTAEDAQRWGVKL